jgi:DtxR family transcriptional regulator, manganese transport regulator
MIKKPPTNRHQRTRSDHSTETAEDYVEAIAEIEASEVKCRVTDLAAYFAVSHVTVNKTLGRLAKEGWVATTPYGPVTLTESGRKLARDCRNRHEIVLHFLRAIGVTDETSLSDAEGIEHHVSEETLECMRRLTESQRTQSSRAKPRSTPTTSKKKSS